MRRVHNTTALYFLNASLVAHADMDCMFVVDSAVVGKPRRWRVATDVQVRSLHGSWCQACCT